MTTLAFRPMVSGRQLEVLRLLAHGNTDQEMADRLGIAVCTVRTHVEGARWALNARNRVHAAALAVTAGLVEMDHLAGAR